MRQESRYIVPLLQEKPDIRNPWIMNDIFTSPDAVKYVEQDTDVTLTC